MGDWWANLDTVTKGFYIAAAFFSVFFLWQLIAALIGLGGSEDADLHAGDADVDHAGVDVDHAGVDVDHGDVAAGDHAQFEHGAAASATQAMAAFKLLSLRSIVAFCTLFAWAGALYLTQGVKLERSLLYALGWGAAAMVIVALLFYGMRRLTETGSPRIASCLGTQGTVYLNIPANGRGEARVAVSGVMSHLKARGAGGREIKAGTPVRVVRILNSSTIEVDLIQDQ